MAKIGMQGDGVAAIAASALRAEQARMRVIAENMANSSSTAATPGGTPYRRQVPVFKGSCPNAWCSFGGVITAISGWAGSGQAATAGRLTRGSSLVGAKLSSGM